MKTCTYKTCTNPQFGGKMCRIHQWARTDKKTKPIAKRSTKEKFFAPDFGFDSQIKMFKHIYFTAKKPIKCPISGIDISDVMNGPITQWIKAFAHILPKGRFPLWKNNPRNCMMVHPSVHQILDQGTQEDRDKHPDYKWGLWDAEVAQAKEDYQEYVISNNL